MNYHAHVYWKNNAEREIAISMRPSFLSMGASLGAIHDRPIGPHPLPMYQIMYDTSIQTEVETLLRIQPMSILLHEDIGIDHVKDHTDGARWINTSLDLDLQFLENLHE
jgi:aromatic ring-cleaving dioxygenase